MRELKAYEVRTRLITVAINVIRFTLWSESAIIWSHGYSSIAIPSPLLSGSVSASAVSDARASLYSLASVLILWEFVPIWGWCLRWAFLPSWSWCLYVVWIYRSSRWAYSLSRLTSTSNNRGRRHTVLKKWMNFLLRRDNGAIFKSCRHRRWNRWEGVIIVRVVEPLDVGRIKQCAIKAQSARRDRVGHCRRSGVDWDTQWWERCCQLVGSSPTKVSTRQWSHRDKEKAHRKEKRRTERNGTGWIRY